MWLKKLEGALVLCVNHGTSVTKDFSLNPSQKKKDFWLNLELYIGQLWTLETLDIVGPRRENDNTAEGSEVIDY